MTEQTQIERLQAEILAIKRAAATGAWCRRNHSDNKPVFSDYDALVARLDKAYADQWQPDDQSGPVIDADFAKESATAIRELRAEADLLRREGGKDYQRAELMEERAEKAEAERDALRLEVARLTCQIEDRTWDGKPLEGSHE